MTPQIEAALIAAAISLVGVLASLVIASRNAASAREQAKLTEWLKDQRDAVARIRAYASSVEKMRSHCWMHFQVATRLQQDTRDRNGTALLMLKNLSLAKSFEEYWQSWADAKPDLQGSGRAEVLAFLRHETRVFQDEIQVTELQLIHLLEARDQTDQVLEVSLNLQKQLMKLLDILDKIFRLTAEQKDLAILGYGSNMRIDA